MTNQTLISMEAVAAKLLAVKQQVNPALTEQFNQLPQLAEAIGLIAWRRQQPRGLAGFAEDLIAFAGDGILPAEFKKLQTDADGCFSIDDALTVWLKLPAWGRPHVGADAYGLVEMIKPAGIINGALAADAGITEVQIDAFRQALRRDTCVQACAVGCIDRLQQCLTDFFFFAERPLAESLAYIGAQDKDRLAEIADRARYLLHLSEASDRMPGTTATPVTLKRWPVMDKLPQIIIAFAHWHADKERQKIALTRVTRLVYEACDYAWDRRVMVQILGSSRYGKTESMKAYCAAHPGRARLVRTPDGNSKKDLLIEIAESLGIAVDINSPVSKIREKVRFVIRHTGLMLMFDEAHQLLPETYNRTTAPARLNMLRSEIVDRGLPCVFSATPQAHEGSIKAYTQKTRYSMEQWVGRRDFEFVLPEQFDHDDLVAVARKRFPALPENALRLIVARAKQAEQFLHAAESIGNWAMWQAKQAGRAAPTIADVSRACDDFVNGVSVPTADRKDQSENKPEQIRLDRSRAAAPSIPEIRTGASLAPERLRSVEPIQCSNV